MKSYKLFILVGIFVFACSPVIPQITSIPYNVCLERNRVTSMSLERGNILISLIDQNLIGDRFASPWMSELNNIGVRHIVGVVEFDYSGKELTLRLDEIYFHKNYYNFSSDDAKLIKNDSVKKERFLDLLELPFFTQTSKLLELTRPMRGYCGTVYVNLLTDPCLPTSNEIPDFEVCTAAKRE